MDRTTEERTLATALYQEDVRLGLIPNTSTNVLDRSIGDAVFAGYVRRAKRILYNLGRVSAEQVRSAFSFEGDVTPRGKAAAAEMARRQLMP